LEGALTNEACASPEAAVPECDAAECFFSLYAYAHLLLPKRFDVIWLASTPHLGKAESTRG
jgi:hypothetical protein